MHRRDWLKWAGASAGIAMIVGKSEGARAELPMCPFVFMHDVFYTGANARVPSNGGVIVMPIFDHETPTPGLRPTYELEQNGHTVPMHVATLAPGMRRLRPPAGMTGACTVHGPAGDRAIELVGEGTRPRPPHLRVLESSPLENRFAPPGGIAVVAKLRDPVPRGIVALIVYLAAYPYVKCFALASPGRTEVEIFRTMSPCDGWIDGESPVWVGEALRLAYVDSVGRVSNQSNHVTVT